MAAHARRAMAHRRWPLFLLAVGCGGTRSLSTAGPGDADAANAGADAHGGGALDTPRGDDAGPEAPRAPLAVLRPTLAVGSEYTCEIRGDGSLWCWGENASGQLGDGTLDPRSAPVRVGAESDWLAVSVGERGDRGSCSLDRTVPATTCGIRAGGRLYCWGANFAGQLGDGTFESRRSPTPVGDASDWVGVSVGAQHTCGIRGAGTLHCWGGTLEVPNSFGCLAGSGPTTPTQVGDGTDWVDVNLGFDAGCARRSDRTLWCWKRHPHQLDPPAAPTAKQLGPHSDWTAVALGGSRICGIRAPDTIWCTSLQSANPSNSDGWIAAEPVMVATGAAEVSIARTNWNPYACLRTHEGQIACWGANTYGQLGNGGRISVGEAADHNPAPIPGPPDWTAVRAGATHTCGRHSDGAVACWGSNSQGRLGLGFPAEKSAPSLAGRETDWTAVGPSCGIRSGRLQCWGRLDQVPVAVGEAADWKVFDDNCGIRGHGTPGTLWCRDNAGNPYQVGVRDDWVKVSDRFALACGRTADGRVHCWGPSRLGEIYNGRPVDQPVPVSLAGDATFTDVSVGSELGCGVRSDRTLWCWKRPAQIVGGNLRDAPVPSQIGTDGIDADWLAVSATSTSICGMRGAGLLLCWSPGNNQAAPAYIEIPGGDWKIVRAAIGKVCAIKVDGSLHCFIPGTGPIAPVALDGPGGWLDVGTDSFHACALGSDGTRWCWGANADGQLGDGDAWRTEPTPVLR